MALHKASKEENLRHFSSKALRIIIKYFFEFSLSPTKFWILISFPHSVSLKQYSKADINEGK